MSHETSQKYPSVIRLLHWPVAVMIIALLVVGFIASNIPKGDSSRHLYLGLHKSVGLTLLALAVLRVSLRLRIAAPPMPEVLPLLQRKFAHFAHLGFYGLMLLMPVSGYVMSTSLGQPVRWFGLDMLRLLGEDRARGMIAKNIHVVAAYALIILLALHIGAALWHYVAHRKNLLQRIV